MSREKVLLTGFGPFGDHNINPSWEVVKELSSKYGKYYEELGIELITQELPVDYKFVQNEVPRLWEEHQPKVKSNDV